MANWDVLNDQLPVNNVKRPSLPTITGLRNALNTFNSTTFSTSRLDAMTENDMTYACRLNGLSVPGL